jgi:hypothetical protein
VQTAPQTLVTVDEVLKAGGKTFAGPGCSLEVLEAARTDDGLIKVRLKVESPPKEINEGAAMPFNGINGVIIINGRVLGGPDRSATPASFALQDDQGRPLALARSDQAGNGPTQGFDLYFRPGEGRPARLVYTGRRGAVVDVPFVLRDVPLP